jgi:hypothetical protein
MEAIQSVKREILSFSKEFNVFPFVYADAGHSTASETANGSR